MYLKGRIMAWVQVWIRSGAPRVVGSHVFTDQGVMFPVAAGWRLSLGLVAAVGLAA